MCVGSPTAGTWSSSQRRPDDEFETDRRGSAISALTICKCLFRLPPSLWDKFPTGLVHSAVYGSIRVWLTITSPHPLNNLQSAMVMTADGNRTALAGRACIEPAVSGSAILES